MVIAKPSVRLLSRRAFAGSTIALAAGAAVTSSWPADYPNGIIRAIAMFPPGSGADAKIRFYGNKLAEKLGATVVVENKTGAMGYIATEYVARARPDGLTIYIAPGSSMFAAAPVLFKNLKFDPINDFEHLTTLNYSTFVLCVAAAHPAKSIAELTDILRKKGANGSYASSAPPAVAFSEIYKKRFGLETLEVKYKDQGPVMADMTSGVVEFTCSDIISVAGLIKGGHLRPLALGSAVGMKSAPGIPGASEAGIPGLDIKNWWSVSVPAKTPKPICARLEVLFNEIAVEPDTLKFLYDNGSDPMPGNRRSVNELLARETENWREYARIARIEPI
jgi:tripartite-type tricarboxylate transporter receptor subunit TctC